MFKKNKGITLIALIITVIIMLILVAVSIDLIVNDKLFNSAGEAVNKTNEKVGQQQGRVDELMGILGEVEESQITEATAGKRANKNLPYYSNGKTAIIPGGFTVSGIPNETTIDEGLVIYDIPASVDTSVENFWTETVTVGDQTYPKVQTEYNQFVWVPVETAYVKASDLAKIINDSNGEITTEVEAMQSLVDNGTYPMAVQLANGTDYRGILYDFSEGTNGVKITVRDFSTTANYNNDGSVTYWKEPAKLSSTHALYVDQTKEPALDLQTEYNNIVKSVANQKGFWVARYELSYNTKGESKRGKTVTTTTDTNTNQWYGLYTACQGMYPTTGSEPNQITGMKSNMIYGSEWDQIMIWMKEVKNTNDNTKYYILDSSYMGNYNASYGGTGAPQVTGYLENYSVKKVFDLGGNLWDWTTEAYSTFFRMIEGRLLRQRWLLLSSQRSQLQPSEKYFQLRFSTFSTLCNAVG